MTTTVPPSGPPAGAQPEDLSGPAGVDDHADVDADSGGLSARDAAILEFERLWWKYAGAKEQAIRDRFGLSATRYYQVLNALIDNPAALARDPILVKRLRRLRSSRQRSRAQRGQGRGR